ncbi:MAG: hydrogenase maturation protease [Candidatus Omnitrophica bacterium]|nr:hydrogenase maturation protease [Candidatus Omnitrophota bacterium]MCA9448251.1 hydrogenase maturation protease [Candidatus Omnitrophota bacterium]
MSTNDSSTTILVIGIGNSFRRDDGAGVEVVRRIEELELENVQTIEQSGEGVSLMAAWEGAESVILVDAVSSGSPPGAIHFLNPIEKEIPSDFFHYSTHAFSVAEAVELARALGKLPPRIWIYGIEGIDFGAGEGFSPIVERSVHEVAGLLAEFVHRLVTDQIEMEAPIDA